MLTPTPILIPEGILIRGSATRRPCLARAQPGYQAEFLRALAQRIVARFSGCFGQPENHDSGARTACAATYTSVVLV